MSSAGAALPPELGHFSLTKHAQTRMRLRAISLSAIEVVLEFGRCVYVRGAQVFALGRKEVLRFRRDGIELENFEGTQVVVTEGGAVLTAYRNRNFRGLRERRHRSSRR